MFFDPIAILAILIALTVHEWSHAYVATRLGDPTSHNEGRLTLNPIAHLDPLGTLLFLLVGFGWAKPVPINPSYFRNVRTGILLTAAAGPFSNLILAMLSYIGLTLLAGGSETGGSVWGLLSLSSGGSIGQMFFVRFLASSIFVNLALMAFNLLPVAPLDGSKVLQAFIPLRYEDQYDTYMRYGPYVLLGLLLAENFLHVPFLSTWIFAIMNSVLWVFQVVVP